MALLLSSKMECWLCLFLHMASRVLIGITTLDTAISTILSNHDALCNITLCDLTLAHFDYIPSLGGNAVYAAIFGVYLITNVFLGIRYKTWGYSAALFLGLYGEIIGYIGRILLYQNPFGPTGNNFLIYLVCLTLSPAFLSAAIDLCLARIVIVYGEHLSRFRPRTNTLIFIGCDIINSYITFKGIYIACSLFTLLIL